MYPTPVYLHENSTYNRVRVIVSTVKKSVANVPAA